jgi:hypothetical protein
VAMQPPTGVLLAARYGDSRRSPKAKSLPRNQLLRNARARRPGFFVFSRVHDRRLLAHELDGKPISFRSQTPLADETA